MPSPKWGIHSPVSSAMVCASEANASITHTTQPRPMTTQTQMTDQVLTDEQLEALNGAGAGALFGWNLANVFTLGIPAIIDSTTGSHIKKAAEKASF